MLGVLKPTIDKKKKPKCETSIDCNMSGKYNLCDFQITHDPKFKKDKSATIEIVENFWICFLMIIFS